jgi:hypothetical protein
MRSAEINFLFQVPREGTSSSRLFLNSCVTAHLLSQCENAKHIFSGCIVRRPSIFNKTAQL